jgi:ankyrin repeat protein
MAPGADQGGMGRTAIHLAVSQGRFDMAQRLVDAGCSIDAQDRLGQTPAHWAASGVKWAGKSEEEAEELSATRAARKTATLAFFQKNGANLALTDKRGVSAAAALANL